MQDKPAIRESGRSKWEQGRYIPKNPSKYLGNPSEIYFRSSWEKKFSHWCDTNSIVAAWGSEELVIPYLHPDGRYHDYFTDYIVWFRTPNGTMKCVVEIKPSAECRPPKPPKRGNGRAYLERCRTFEINQQKWKYARAWCRQHGYGFIILTEKELEKQPARRRKTA